MFNKKATQKCTKSPEETDCGLMEGVDMTRGKWINHVGEVRGVEKNSSGLKIEAVHPSAICRGQHHGECLLCTE